MKINYNEQQRNNLASLFEDDFFFGRKRDVLLKIIGVFSKYGVEWSLLCSSQLFCKGIVDNFGDFDILVANNSIEDLKKSLSEINATSREQGDQSCFDSSFFERYQVDGIDLDIVSDYTVVTFGKRYRYSYKKAETIFLKIQGIEIPLIAMEAQFLLYRMMEGWQIRRRLKSQMIETYLQSEGLKHKEIFEDALEQNIPDFLRSNIKMLLY